MQSTHSADAHVCASVSVVDASEGAPHSALDLRSESIDHMQTRLHVMHSCSSACCSSVDAMRTPSDTAYARTASSRASEVRAMARIVQLHSPRA
jgi:hypothetical protein